MQGEKGKEMIVVSHVIEKRKEKILLSHHHVWTRKEVKDVRWDIDEILFSSFVS